MELASLSDLLGLEGLKEVTAYALKINYCHNFHKVSFNLITATNDNNKNFHFSPALDALTGFYKCFLSPSTTVSMSSTGNV